MQKKNAKNFSCLQPKHINNNYVWPQPQPRRNQATRPKCEPGEVQLFEAHAKIVSGYRIIQSNIQNRMKKTCTVSMQKTVHHYLCPPFS